MILGIGEILVDIFKSSQQVTVLPGGAPFNVVSNVLSFDSNSSFYGVVGDDEYGHLLLEFVNSKKFTKPLIEIDKSKETTQAIVTLENGERNFKFVRENGADYCLKLEKLDEIDYSSVNIVHFGSLMLSEERGRNFLRSAISYYRNNYPSIKLSFDVNYRDDIFDSREQSIEIYNEFIKLFDIVKFSKDEVEILSQNEDYRVGIKKLTLPTQFVFITFGEEGSMLKINNYVFKAKSCPIKPIDTTGAGDAFYSYILSKMDKIDLLEFNEEQINNILFRANCVGALATQKKGAVDIVPSEEDVDAFISKMTK